MRPTPEEVLKIIQGGVMMQLMPEVQSSYAKAQFAFMMLLFSVAQRDMDSAVPDVIEANASLRSLLGDADGALASLTTPAATVARASVAALPAPADTLRLSALRAENDALRTILASLTPLIEPAGDDTSLAPLRDVRAKIYAHLSADAKRRIVPILSA